MKELLKNIQGKPVPFINLVEDMILAIKLGRTGINTSHLSDTQKQWLTDNDISYSFDKRLGEWCITLID